MFDNLALDLARCGDTRYRRIRELILNTGMWAVVGYRFRRWLQTAALPWPVSWLLRFPAVLLQLLTEITSNIDLPGTADIGPGLYIAHTGFIIIGRDAVLGSNCTLTQGVTIGQGGRTRTSSSPRIGDRVYVGPGSIVIGPITIGQDALIGAGAVVTHSVPARGIVAGNPARLLGQTGSFQLIHYPGMENDAARLASLSKVSTEAVEALPTSAVSAQPIAQLLPASMPHLGVAAPVLVGSGLSLRSCPEEF